MKIVIVRLFLQINYTPHHLANHTEMALFIKQSSHRGVFSHSHTERTWAELS